MGVGVSFFLLYFCGCQRENPFISKKIPFSTLKYCPITNPIVASTKKERGYGANIG